MTDVDAARPDGPDGPDGHTASGGPPRRRAARRRATGGEPVLPPSPDDSDVGWGDHPRDDDERFRRELPPHWGRD